MPVAFRLTARQWDLLQRICAVQNENMRAGVNRYAPEITPPEMIRMLIMTTAENMGIIPTLLDEPREAFDLPRDEEKKERAKLRSKSKK